MHGHDEAALQAVARFLERLKLEAIVLREQPDQGRTIIEKFEDRWALLLSSSRPTTLPERLQRHHKLLALIRT